MPVPLRCTRCLQTLRIGSTGLCAKCELDFSYSTRAIQTLDNPSQNQLATPAGPETTIESERLHATLAETLTRAGAIGADTATFGDKLESAEHPPIAPNGYELRRMLGGGGMGDVYLAWEQSTERLVAMKFLRAAGRGAWQRFLVEVRALAAINHPNIVRVIATDFQRSEPYFTMEYAPGGTLADRVHSEGPLDAIEGAKLMSVVARAVDAAHQQEVLHRDLKPSNILLDADGSPKVSDFGLAKRMDRDDKVTQHVGAMGTPGYMPPEQIENHENIGVESDVYGLGATLFHLLTGRAPFTGDSREMILERVKTQTPPRPRALCPSMPMDMEAILLKSLEKDPKKRYRTAAELADDLDRFLAEQPVTAPRLTFSSRVRQRLRQNRKPIARSLMAILAAVGLIYAGTWIAGRGTDPDTAEAIQKELASNGKAELLKPDGMPRHYRSLLAKSNPEANPKDRSCTFHASEHGMWDLIPNPKIDRYRVHLLIRHVDSRVQRGVNADDRDFLAFYFGHAQASADDGANVHLFASISYSDCDPQSLLNKRPIVAQPVFLREFLLSQSPEGDVTSSRIKAASKKFTPPSAVPPGNWRPVIIDVSPDEVRVQWQADDGSMVDLIRWNGDKMRERYRELRDKAEAKHPGAFFPEWTPQMPLGLYSFKTDVAVKDLTIEKQLPAQE